MSADENKSVLNRIYDEVINKGNIELIDELIAPEYVLHGGPNMPMEVKGLEGFKQYINMIRTGMPDCHMAMEDIIAEGDKVVHRFTLRGTHTGQFGEIPPTGNKIEITGTVTSRFAGGKEAESWMNSDNLTMFQQMGVIPPLD